MAISVQESEIGSLFVGYFGRSVDPAGRAYWVGQLNNGTLLTSIAQSFSVQPEATALYPFLTHPTLRDAGDFVVAIYRNLFNREVDDAGLAFWVFELGLGRLVGPMILNIISGALHADLATINNKSTVAIEYAQAFDAVHKSWTPADLASSRSVLAGVTFDPATVKAAETKIHDIVNPTSTPLWGSPNDDVLIGNAAMNTIQGYGGNDTLTGGDGVDTFRVDAGRDTITDLGAGGADIVQVLAAGATARATLVADWTASSPTSNSGTANVDAAGFNVNLGAIFAGSGWTLTNSSATGITMTGSALGDTIAGNLGNDTIDGSFGNDTINGGGGADSLTGGDGHDTFVFASRATTQTAAFLASDTDAANVDKILDFTGGGAAVADVILLGTGANAFGSMTFAETTTANVRAVAAATADTFNALAMAVQANSGGGIASSNAVARNYDVTVGAGNLEGRWLIINDSTATISASDTIIRITGITGALQANDFEFA
jgi:hypothetical protein